jgi:hypothetical protein
VRAIFDASQRQLSLNRTGTAVVLAYLVACITRWTTHFVAFARLLALRAALTAAVDYQRNGIIGAEVGAATSTEKERLTADATLHCNLIKEDVFWAGLEQVAGDIEAICYATNLAQKDSTRADQVLLALAGIYLRFSEHPELEIKHDLLPRIEKRWKECDQPLFILALILNPWEKLSRFGENADLDHFQICDMVVQV